MCNETMKIEPCWICGKRPGEVKGEDYKRYGCVSLACLEMPSVKGDKDADSLALIEEWNSRALKARAPKPVVDQSDDALMDKERIVCNPLRHGQMQGYEKGILKGREEEKAKALDVMKDTVSRLQEIYKGVPVALSDKKSVRLYRAGLYDAKDEVQAAIKAYREGKA